jgi:plastocyanin
VKALVEHAGGTVDNVVRITTYVTDVRRRMDRAIPLSQGEVAMRRVMRMLAVVVALTLGLGVGEVWAIAKVTVAREGSKPKTIEIRAGEAVQFINASGSTAHLWFGDNDTIRFYVEKAGSTIRFEKPGTYDYTVYVTAAKVHSHTGRIIVK